MAIIYRLRQDEAVQFAAEELARYLARMDGGLQFEARDAARYEAGMPGIWLGLLEDFGIASRSGRSGL